MQQTTPAVLPRLGLILALCGWLLFSLHDAAIKWLVADYSAWQILFVRSAVVLAICLAIGRRRLALQAATSPVRRALLLRSVIFMAAWLCYFTAARYLQLAELVTLYFGSPLMVAALAAPMLGEKVPPTRWAFILIGFAGVVVACWPAALNTWWPVGLVLLAALLLAYSMILIRQIARAEPTLVQMLVANTTFLILCGAAMPWAWVTPDLIGLALMLLVGVIGAAGQFTIIESIRHVPASVVAPLEFTALVWSFLLGYAIWGDVPDWPVFVGAALILASGTMIVTSEWDRSGTLRARIAPPRDGPAL
ncbi:MAG TPA: DMT family transporter [Alphaproteobacteria bacterium]|nr:DMT family transporter [Alphaproteobacteria bacterium]